MKREKKEGDGYCKPEEARKLISGLTYDEKLILHELLSALLQNPLPGDNLQGTSGIVA